MRFYHGNLFNPFVIVPISTDRYFYTNFLHKTITFYTYSHQINSHSWKSVTCSILSQKQEKCPKLLSFWNKVQSWDSIRSQISPISTSKIFLYQFSTYKNILNFTLFKFLFTIYNSIWFYFGVHSCCSPWVFIVTLLFLSYLWLSHWCL